MSGTINLPHTCPKCGAEIEAIPMNAQELVFTRHRLIHMLD